MPNFQSKYTGKEVEDLLDKVNEGGGGTDLQYYSENTSAGTATINAPNEVNISTGGIALVSNGYTILRDSSAGGSMQMQADNHSIMGYTLTAMMSTSFQISDGSGSSGIFGSSEQVQLKSKLATYNGNEIATVKDLEGYATLDMVDTALNTIKAALPSATLLDFLDSWFASGKDYITSAEIVDYTEDTSMVRIRFTCEGYASEGAYYFVLALEDGGNMPITTESGNTGTSEGYLVYGVFDIVVKLTYSMGIYAFSTINQKYTLELSDKITDLASLQKAYPSSTLVSMVGSYWINQLSSHTQSTTIKIMDYDSETNSVRLRFYGRVTSNIQGLAIYESSSTKYLIQFVPRTASNYHLTFDLVVPFVNGEFLPFSTLLYIVDYV